MRHKGDDSCVAKRNAEIIKSLRYTKVVLKSDQASGIVEAERRVRERLRRVAEGVVSESSHTGIGQLVLQTSPAGEWQANGAAEIALQRMQGHIRAIKLDVEAATGARIGASHPLWPWFVEFVAQPLLLRRINPTDGLASIQRICGKSRVAPKLWFAEQVM